MYAKLKITVALFVSLISSANFAAENCEQPLSKPVFDDVYALERLNYYSPKLSKNDREILLNFELMVGHLVQAKRIENNAKKIKTDQPAPQASLKSKL